MEATQCHISPEVVSVVTDGAVGKFLQLTLVWMEKSNMTNSKSEEVSGAADDNLTSKLTKEENRLESPDVYDSPAAPPSSLVSPVEDCELSACRVDN